MWLNSIQGIDEHMINVDYYLNYAYFILLVKKLCRRINMFTCFSICVQFFLQLQFLMVLRRKMLILEAEY